MIVKTFLVVVSVAAVGASAPFVQQPPTQAAPLTTVIEAMRGPRGEGQHKALLGKTFVGSVVLQAVRISPSDPFLAVLDVSANHETSTGVLSVRMRFEGNADDPLLAGVRRGDPIRLEGKLKALSATVADFTEFRVVPAGAKPPIY